MDRREGREGRAWEWKADPVQAYKVFVKILAFTLSH